MISFAMPIFNVHNLEKSFAGKLLFKGVNFGLEANDRVGLVGPNGAGKSTLLKIISGRMTSDNGQVTLQRGLKIGFLEQSPSFKEGDTIYSTILSKTHDPHESMALAYEWMGRLELNQFGDDFPVASLSGGWKKKVALARELVTSPDLLLMDEPTNHLDISSILWLEDYLKSAPFSLLMITHDRLFLQRVVNRIIDLDPKNPNYILSVAGDYTNYVETKEQLLQAQQKKETVLKNTLRRETEWLRRGAQARQTKQKARIENAGALAEEVNFLEKKNRDRKIGIEFSENDRNPKKLIETEGISKIYNGKTLFEDLDLLIRPTTRLALLGDNGCGKSTLIRALIGQVKPDKGTIKAAEGLKVVYFEQNRETLDPKLSVLKNIVSDGDYVSFRGQHIYARSYLERFHFYSQMADLAVERLSGGEQARLRIAQMMLQDGQVLILDEPTNDLDVETLAVLEDALREFNGAVILVTHDRYFMDAVCNDILAFPVSEYGPKTLQRFTGYLQYEAWFEQQKSNEKSKIASAAAAAKNSGGKAVKLSFKEKYELENMEAHIHLKENEMSGLQAELLSPEVLSNSGKLVELTSKAATLQSEIERLYSRWAELEKKSQPQ
jgi:ATP-binding cassette subfamily F protein uup